MSSVIWSQGDSIASTILRTPAAVRPRPQWFSNPRTTPHSSARGRSFSIELDHPAEGFFIGMAFEGRLDPLLAP